MPGAAGRALQGTAGQGSPYLPCGSSLRRDRRPLRSVPAPGAAPPPAPPSGNRSRPRHPPPAPAAGTASGSAPPAPGTGLGLRRPPPPRVGASPGPPAPVSPPATRCPRCPPSPGPVSLPGAGARWHGRTAHRRLPRAGHGAAQPRLAPPQAWGGGIGAAELTHRRRCLSFIDINKEERGRSRLRREVPDAEEHRTVAQPAPSTHSPFPPPSTSGCVGSWCPGPQQQEGSCIPQGSAPAPSYAPTASSPNSSCPMDTLVKVLLPLSPEMMVTG